MEQSNLESKINSNYDVLTPHGWQSFSRIKRTTNSNLIKIIFDDASELICTDNHLIKLDSIDKFVEVNTLDSGDIVTGKKVWEIIPQNSKEFVYDLVDVDDHEYYTNNIVSHNCTFLGSAGTLISAAALKNMVFERPSKILLDNSLEIYEEPKPEHFYVCVVDSSRGQGLDYAAFLVFDCTAQPFKVVAKYRNNTISPMLFPNPIVNTARYYNQAYLLIENNDVGAQVADLCLFELEYDNMFHGEEANGKFYLNQNAKAKQLGIKTTKKVKRQGCNALKQLVENGKLEISDFTAIEELSTFILKRDGVYAAEEGAHDDLAMCLVLFSWLTAQPYFRDLTNFDIRQKLYDEKIKAMEEDLPILPVTTDDLQDKPAYFRAEGVIWQTMNSDDETEEYGKSWFTNY
jgi:Terminase RNaseH-like domain